MCAMVAAKLCDNELCHQRPYFQFASPTVNVEWPPEYHLHFRLEERIEVAKNSTDNKISANVRSVERRALDNIQKQGGYFDTNESPWPTERFAIAYKKCSRL
jgi:hypothetical protein